MPFLISFLIQSYLSFTDSYHSNHENMRNEFKIRWFFVKFRAFLCAKSINFSKQ